MNYNLLILSPFFVAIWLILFYLLYQGMQKPIIQEDNKKELK